MTRRSIRSAAFACIAGLVGVACGGASDSEESSPTAPAVVEAAPETAAPADALVAVPALLQFTAPLVGGGELVGDELAGKPTAFWFWSPT